MQYGVEDTFNVGKHIVYPHAFSTWSHLTVGTRAYRLSISSRPFLKPDCSSERMSVVASQVVRRSQRIWVKSSVSEFIRAMLRQLCGSSLDPFLCNMVRPMVDQEVGRDSDSRIFLKMLSRMSLPFEEI